MTSVIDDIPGLPIDSPDWREALAASHPSYEFESYSTGLARKWSARAR